ncbi:MAG: hypothetical protein KZQ99_02390 [Candidatus Thiodiazotropha sp. (ex Dulcina madagascariensis)]|nr:hypothetical protein [Candidatus Thiodiazotropha sp. (ex Dulcina madagascariensis)]
MKASIPNKRKDYVRSFCNSLVLGVQPQYVPHQPVSNKPRRECFSIVPEHIATYGGKQNFGWAIFEIKRVWLEAEFHVVWEREDGRLIDLTPREAPLSKILFVHDPKRKYEGIQVDSVFKALTKNPSVKRFIELAGEHFRATNEGDLAKINTGPIIQCSPELKARILKIQNEMDEVKQAIFSEYAR